MQIPSLACRYILSELVKVFGKEEGYLAALSAALTQLLSHATTQITTYEQVGAGVDGSLASAA